MRIFLGIMGIIVLVLFVNAVYIYKSKPTDEDIINTANMPASDAGAISNENYHSATRAVAKQSSAEDNAPTESEQRAIIDIANAPAMK